MDYVFAAANLKAFMFGIEQCQNRHDAIEMMKTAKVEEFQPKSGVLIQVDESEAQNTSQNVDRDRISDLIEKLEQGRLALESRVNIKAIEFEKDDDTNFHMDYIVACSNLRAENYGIAPASRHKVSVIK